MRAIARHTTGLQHTLQVRGHEFTADEPTDHGGDDSGPSPQELLAASLASCMAITMEMYAGRKDWDVSGIEVECQYTAAERGSPSRFETVVRMPAHLDSEQRDRLLVIAAKCPVHRALEGEVIFDERVETA